MPRSMSRLALGLVAALGFAQVTLAQAPPINGMRTAEVRVHAITDATVVVKPGETVDDATILIRDGVIEAVGTAVDIPEGARVWDAEGMTIYPGFIDAAVYISAGDPPTGAGAHWNPKIRPQINIADQPAPDDALRKKLRSLGFGAAALYPNSGIFRGTGAVLAMAEDDDDALAYAEHALMAAALERGGRYPGSLMGSIALVRQTLADTRWHAACREVYDNYPEGNEPPIRADALVALDDVANRRQTVLMTVDDEHSALRAASLARELKLDLVLVGSGMEFRRAREIASTNVPIIVPLKYPEAPDVETLSQTQNVTLRDLLTWEQAPTNARRLSEAGVDIALTTHLLKDRGSFFGAAQNAIKHGLAEDAALAAITTTPARMLGLDGVLGTIEPGKAANLVVVEGDLFTKKPKIRDTWINGRRYEISSKPTLKLVGAGTFRLDPGVEAPITIDTDKKKVTITLGEGEDATDLKAKGVVFSRDRLAFTIDGRIVDTEGYVQFSGVYSGETVTGSGVTPDGDRLAFEISALTEVVDESDDGDESNDETSTTNTEVAVAPENPVTGEWDAVIDSPEIPAEASGFALVLNLEDDGSISGSIESPMFSAGVSNGSWDAGSGAITFLVDTGEMTAEVKGTITGDKLVGEVGAGDMRMPLRATRTATVAAAGDAGTSDDADFEMPPADLVYPLGAYGVAQKNEARDVLITNATIWTCGPDGIMTDASMLVRDGRIEGIYPADEAPNPPGILVVDAEGKHVTPGLIDCHSHTGVSGGVNEMGQTNTAEVGIEDVVNPDDINWYRQLAGGLTMAHQLHGSANPIGGRNSVVKLKWGGSARDFRVRDAIPGIKFALGENVKRSSGRYPDTRMGVEAFIRDAFAAAEEYRANWQTYNGLSDDERARTMPPQPDIELDVLVEILEGRRLVHCHSYRQDEILMLLRVAESFGFRIGTLQHVLEGYKVADSIAAHGAGASSFSDWWAYKVEVMDAVPYNGTLMHRVGVLVSFNSDSSELARRMNTEAAKAVRYGGLEPHEALKFVTLNPARQLRVDHRVGSLEPGKDADFAIWSGDPLSTYTMCEQTWIEGTRMFDLETDRELREQIRNERRRLIQKLLARSHGKTKRNDDTKPDAKPALLEVN